MFGTSRMFQLLAACSISMAATLQSAWPAQIAGSNDQAASSNEISQPGIPEKSTVQVDPNLSVEFVSQPSIPGGPFLVVGYYDLTRGLLAGYQASNGRRILFKAAWVANGSVVVSATHFDAQRGRPYSFYSPRTRDGNNATLHMQLAGMDVVQYFRAVKNEPPGRRHDPIGDFIESDSGEAFFEGVPALFAQLEALDLDPKLSALQAQFGATLTLLQLASNKLTGFRQADAVIGSAHANEFRSACQGKCEFAGKSFMVHKNGLFDNISKRQSSFTKMILGGTTGPFRLKNGDGICDNPGPCFGRCGERCDGQPWMGNVYTAACTAHDLCVCMWGGAACIFFDSSNPPNGYCPGCGDLWDAAVSFIWEVVNIVVDWLMGVLGGGEVPDVDYQ